MQRPFLVIEDSDSDYSALEWSLRSAGVVNELIRCSSGAEMRTYLSHLGEVQTSMLPLLIVLDLHVAGEDGRDLLKQVRKDPTLGAIPVIVMSSSNSASDIESCYQAGANSYMVKPFTLEDFESMMKAVRSYWMGAVTLPPLHRSLPPSSGLR